MGFLPESAVTSKPPLPTLMKCNQCKLYKDCKSPKMPTSGEGKRKILIIAEAPGREEDDRGIQLIGQSGKFLSDILRSVGVIMRRDCWLENAIICRPEKNRTPTDREIDFCRPHIIKAIEKLDPNVIVLLGAVAVKSVIGTMWKSVGASTAWMGWQIPCQDMGRWICPTFHPSYVMRSAKGEFNGNPHPILEESVKVALGKAFALSDSKPRKVDYTSQVEVVRNSEQAAKALDEMTTRGRPVAFDYETNRLKPDAENARIVCCSVSDGERTIAYPWHGSAVTATGRLLHSRVPKIGWNLKFEDRWTRKEFGKPVRNWKWDGMLATHVLDNRSGICSAKFQAFVRLGLSPYNDHIEPFLSGGKKDGTNRIEEIDLYDLLLYCGIDSLVEYRIAELQMKEMR